MISGFLKGDIIRWTNLRGIVRKSAVSYDYEWNRFVVWLNGAESVGVNRHLSKDIEIVGNIYDN